VVEGVEEPRRNDQAREDAIIVSKLVNNYISVKKMKGEMVCLDVLA
jgi:hypothetical protein